ncbi:MAG: type II secretion system minor pseudopilin GspI [Gammaproteobacteria bacterium]|nr:type II secretion system minor pseudopilin GspI [Gammaproteobacteria bacterium]
MAIKNRGFTLIEMLLALAVFAYAASSILGVLGQSARNLSDIEQMTFASWVANDRLVELQYDKQWPPKDKAKGEREMAGQLWYWQQKIEKTQDNNLRSVTVDISTDKEGSQSIYSLTTFVSKPNSAKPSRG